MVLARTRLRRAGGQGSHKYVHTFVPTQKLGEHSIRGGPLHGSALLCSREHFFASRSEISSGVLPAENREFSRFPGSLITSYCMLAAAVRIDTGIEYHVRAVVINDYALRRVFEELRARRGVVFRVPSDIALIADLLKPIDRITRGASPTDRSFTC